MKVQVQLENTAQPLVHDAVNAYVKGPFYCVYVLAEGVYKYPLANIWRVCEDYGTHVLKETT